jgi:thymidylate kinase
VIIVEGMDGSGKSTLCEMLLAEGVVDQVLPSPRIPAKGDSQRMKYETDRYLRLHGDNNRVAVDRYLFSEMAYGMILRGKSVFSQGEYLHKLVQLMLKGSIVIFCLPDKLNFKADENPKVIEKEAELRAIYNTLVQEQALTSPRTYIYKWDEDGAFNRLKKFIQEQEVFHQRI